MDAKELIAAARQQTGLVSLGDDAILEGLNQLVDALNREAKLSERGRRNMEGIIVGTLANRLRVENHLAEHPDLLERPIDRPLFVFGLPRTGTTLDHQSAERGSGAPLIAALGSLQFGAARRSAGELAAIRAA